MKTQEDESAISRDYFCIQIQRYKKPVQGFQTKLISLEDSFPLFPAQSSTLSQQRREELSESSSYQVTMAPHCPGDLLPRGTPGTASIVLH